MTPHSYLIITWRFLGAFVFYSFFPLPTVSFPSVPVCIFSFEFIIFVFLFRLSTQFTHQPSPGSLLPLPSLRVTHERRPSIPPFTVYSLYDHYLLLVLNAALPPPISPSPFLSPCLGRNPILWPIQLVIAHFHRTPHLPYPSPSLAHSHLSVHFLPCPHSISPFLFFIVIPPYSSPSIAHPLYNLLLLFITQIHPISRLPFPSVPFSFNLLSSL